jgi:hypothetical protein
MLHLRKFLPMLHPLPMYTPHTEYKKRISLLACFKAWSGILLLIFYFFGSHLQQIHTSLHSEHHQRVLHSPQQENDPCHRNLFHHEKNACEHKTHISNSEKCSLCEWNVYKEEWVASNEPATGPNHVAIINSTVVSFIITDLSIHLCSRAPPIF